ncbi:response regulator [Leptolyngbya sp. NK1-12]|uniref:Response regulator n=1 Tax=Leptolyngbya sp. NK1-12 TaxID=2547451 RepID=A0AA96WM20_9CYAN|nr:response regulator [Leptolyngbya sp. NK1-12]
MEASSAQPVLLVIEDDDPVREVITNCFEDIAGWKVIATKSGQEGLKLVASQHPKAIVLDVMMPEMDGITFLQQLRELNTTHLADTPAVPVIIITAYSSGLNSSELTALGVKGVIAKPFDPFRLTKQTAELLGWV